MLMLQPLKLFFPLNVKHRLIFKQPQNELNWRTEEQNIPMIQDADEIYLQGVTFKKYTVLK